MSLLTGFLGSGKTTPLNRLVRDPAMARLLVIINEFGSIGIDHHAVQHIFHPPILLDAWPDADRRTRMVFITRDIEERTLRETLAFMTQAGPYRLQGPADIDLGGWITPAARDANAGLFVRP